MKIKKISKISVMSLLMAMIIFALSSQTVMALSTINAIKAKEIRLNTVMENRIAELEENNYDLHPEEGEVNITILSTKKISDMVGNIYTLTECEPTGYMIFHDESGTFVESSIKSISPYIGLDDSLYYFGPGEYYQKEDNELKHTVLDKSISLEYSDELEENSNELNDILLVNKDNNIVNYINGTEKEISLNSNTKYSVSSTKTYKGMICVKGYKFFTLLSECGINKYGSCGYIAAGMLLSFYKRYYGGDIVDSKYLSGFCTDNDMACRISDSLHQKLLDWGIKLGYVEVTRYDNGRVKDMKCSSDSGIIKNVINTYLNDRGISKDYVEGIVPLKNNFTITESIDNGHPVIWFGNVFNNSHNDMTFFNHAIVVYGYKWSGLSPEYIAHFGWTGANEVYFSGILGSLFAFTSNSWDYI